MAITESEACSLISKCDMHQAQLQLGLAAPSPHRQLRVLAVTATESSSATRTRIRHNIEASRQLTDVHMGWALVVYDNNVNAWSEELLAHDAHRGVFVCAGGLGLGYHPKFMYVGRFLPLFPLLDAVFLLDSDVKLASFSPGLPEFFLRWRCVFSAGWPLVAQPLSNGKTFASLTKNTWLIPNRSFLGAAVPYVDEQAALLDARFLHWFIQKAGCTMAHVQEYASAGNGMSHLWCRAAQSYAAQGYAHANNRAGCAIIVAVFDEDNTHSTQKPSTGNKMATRWNNPSGAATPTWVASTNFSYWFSSGRSAGAALHWLANTNPRYEHARQVDRQRWRASGLEAFSNPACAVR